MILYIVNGIVQWLHEDITIKQQEQFINDDKIRVMKYDGEKLYTEVIGAKPLTQWEAIQKTYNVVNMTSEDTLINMELNTDTNTKVTVTGDDSLLLMEMLITIDEKLTQLLSPSQA